MSSASALPSASACCGQVYRGTCCAKCWVVLGYLLALLALVAYAIFPALAVLSRTSLAQEELREYLGVCESSLPVLEQAKSDAEAILQLAENADPPINAQDLADQKAEYDRQSFAFANFEALCGGATGLFDELPSLFAPGAIAIAAALLAMFVLNGECCAANCCSKPTAWSEPVKMTPAGSSAAARRMRDSV